MRTSVIPRYVLDASIAVKWFLDDEDHVAEAARVLQGFRDNQIDLIAPDHIRYEVSNAMLVASRAGRVSLPHAREAIARFLSWQIPTVGSTELVVQGFEFASTYGCAFYDGLYLALSSAANCPLVFADRRLKNSLRGRFLGAL